MFKYIYREESTAYTISAIRETQGYQDGFGACVAVKIPKPPTIILLYPLCPSDFSISIS